MNEMDNKDNNIIGKLNIFTKFVETIKKNGVVYSLIGALLFIVIYNVVVSPLNLNELADRLIDKTTETHNESIDRREFFNKVAPNILESIRKNYNVDRVMLFEASNGSTSLTGLSFLYFNCTLEKINLNDMELDYVADQYQRVLQSQYFDFLTELQKKGYIYYSNLSEKSMNNNNRLLRKLYKNNTNSFLCYPIHKGGRLIGLLTISSVNPELNINEISKSINENISIIKELL